MKGQIGQLLCGRSEGRLPLSLCIDACHLLALESSRRLTMVSGIEAASSLLM
jgi:hypothetical protein